MILATLVFIVNYIYWTIHQLELFCFQSRKLNLISTLANRALMMCSTCKLDFEMEIIHVIFRENVYLENVITIKITISRMLKSFKTLPIFCPVSGQCIWNYRGYREPSRFWLIVQCWFLYSWHQVTCFFFFFFLALTRYFLRLLKTVCSTK